MSTRIVVMGPSGCGKSTVGRALADRIGARFIDADDLHPLSNVEKMAAGVPLDDEDRMPWLALVGRTLQREDRIVVACSALRRVYRDTIRTEAPEAFFAELVVDRTALEERVRSRADHFMPPALLASQLQTLEPLQGDEPGVRVERTDVAQSVALIAQTVL
ncbi:gluconokinase [Microbacterium paraoxydans]|uniref:gluconokinase n=1 Tax=Microbacterium paraoxydans TaxID=199592 RepID=UPI001CFBA5AD|nr:gluconokinase [Microbacterium paraoxydans]